MQYQGIIFDFNGTLFFDSDKNEAAWKQVSKELRGTALNDEEMRTVMHGRTNKSLLAYLLGDQPDEETLNRLSEQKEKLYREMCLEDREHLTLAPGASELLTYLCENQIPHTIATAAGESNLLFYKETLHIADWFNLEQVVYDDGSLPGKPAPDIYLKAASNIGIPPESCVVVEDAASGIEAAYRAHIGRITAIGPADSHARLKRLDGVNETICNFAEFDRTIFRRS